MPTFSYLIVGGGAGGGCGGAGQTRGAGGGGAGDVETGSTTLAFGASYAVVVGAGGAGSTNPSVAGFGGDPSSFNGISAHGGGAGSSGTSGLPVSGGSGGGSGDCGGTSQAGAAAGVGSHVSAGGANSGSTSFGGSGGGGGGSGGAGAVGVNSGGSRPAGGIGTASSISGASVTYAAGGAGGSYNGNAAGADGTANLGNGGGGGDGQGLGSGKPGGRGGDGIVIISFPAGSATCTGGTISFAGGNQIHTFTSSGTFIVGDMAARAGISLSSNASLQATAHFGASPSIAFAATATLTGRSRFAAAATVGISAAANLTAPHPFTMTVLVNGVNVSGAARRSSLRIEDVLNSEPNRCHVTLGTPTAIVPTIGNTLVVELGAQIIFGGTLTRVDQGWDAQLQQVNWNCEAVDYGSYLLNRRRPVKTYVNVSVSSIVTDLINTFTTGFTASSVVGGLAATTIAFDGTATVSACLTRLANLVGANWFVDYSKNLHFFTSHETDLTPDALTSANRTAKLQPALSSSSDMTDVGNRYILVGGGTLGGQAMVASPGALSGALTIPLNQAAGFAPSGYAVIDVPVAGTYPQVNERHVVSYSGVGQGGIVAPPGISPVFTGTSGTGNCPQGQLYYVMTYETSAGETVASPVLSIFIASYGGPATGAVIVSLGSPPADLSVRTINVYRSLANGSSSALFSAGSISAPFAGTILFTDKRGDSELGTSPPTGGICPQGISSSGPFPALTGVAPFIGGTVPNLPIGTAVRVAGVIGDATAQSAQAAREGGDGIHEKWIEDESAVSPALCSARASAYVDYAKNPITTIKYTTRDTKTRSGRGITVSLGAPNNLSGTFLIQRVVISKFDPAGDGHQPPTYEVEASSQRRSFERLLARLGGLLTINGQLIA